MFGEDVARGLADPCPGEGGEADSAMCLVRGLCSAPPLHELQMAEGRVIYGFGLNYRSTDPDYLSRNLYN
jgi:hypothetical protein